MLIEESGLLRAIKSAYKNGGYVVNNQGEMVSVYTERWYVQCKRVKLPRKVLATIVEHMGMIPEEGAPVSIIKDGDPQQMKRVALSSAQQGRIHPTQKPVALYAWIFAKFAKPGDRILDTHLGSGSSRIAAWDAALDFVGYEIDQEYFEAQERRFRDHAAQLSMFAGGGGHPNRNNYSAGHAGGKWPGKEGDMEVTVRMSAEEFLEFVDWEKNRDMYERQKNDLRRDIGGRLEAIAAAVLGAIKPMEDNQEAFEIVEQGHMSDAWDLAGDVFA